MSPVTVYDFHDEPVRLVTDESNEPFWVAIDVCRILGYANPSETLKRVPHGDLRKIEVIDALGRAQPTNVLTLKGLNFLILGSHKPEADAFRKFAATILTECQTTGQVAPKHPLLDPHEPIAHLVEDTRKTTSKHVNAVAYALGGSQAARAANVGLSLASFGQTPTQKVHELEATYGLTPSTSRGLPATLTKTEPDKAAGYSLMKQAALNGQDMATAVA